MCVGSTWPACSRQLPNVLGTAILTNVSASAQSWLYRPDWNMMRVTRRGPGIPAEWFVCDVLSQFFYMTFR